MCEGACVRVHVVPLPFWDTDAHSQHLLHKGIIVVAKRTSEEIPTSTQGKFLHSASVVCVHVCVLCACVCVFCVHVWCVKVVWCVCMCMCMCGVYACVCVVCMHVVCVHVYVCACVVWCVCMCMCGVCMCGVCMCVCAR